MRFFRLWGRHGITQPRLSRWWYRQVAFFQSVILLSILGVMLVGVHPGFGQTLDPTSLLRLNPLLSSVLEASRTNTSIETASVDLDGHYLFTIAVPAAGANPDGEGITSLAEQRAREIERLLNRWIQEGFDPNQLVLRSKLDEKTNLPIITINDQYLMTVTTLDAQIQGDDPDRVAEKLTRIIKTTLLEARQERLPETLGRRGAFSAGILLVLVILSHRLSHLRRTLRERHHSLQSAAPSDSRLEGEFDSAFNGEVSTTMLQLRQQQTIRLSRITRQLVFLGQIASWAIGIFVIFGFFPQTRWLQPIVLSTPLKVVGIVLGIYVAVRISGALIDRAFSVMGTDDFLPLRASQRLALRIKTISSVVQSVVSILLIATGTLSGLAVLGVNLLPLLAGAGIVGIAMSLASQNVIKDIINGFLILLEDQYAVGDVIALNEVGGLVENMNLRITQLRNNEGRLITVPNSTITVVQNLSKDWARVDLTVRVALGVDPTQTFQLLQQLAEEIYRDRVWRTKILEVPEVLGIDEIAHTGILIRIWIKTQPLEQWAVAREFRRRLQQMLVQEGVEIGVPQQALWLHGLNPPTQETLRWIERAST